MNFKKALAILVLILILLGLGLIGKFFIFDFQPQTFGALQVNSIPKAAVYLNGKDIGQTPVDLEKVKPGEYQLKLATTASASGNFAWEAKIRIIPGTLTFISREIGSTDDMSSGQVLTLEKIPSSTQSEVMVVSSPDGATIAVDGLEKGKASMVIKQISAGSHVLVISLPGFNDQIIRANIIGGYRLNAIVKLSKSSPAFEQIKARPTEEMVVATSSSEMAKPNVLIKDTPLGFLRVRKSPNVSAPELGKVLPGEKYPLVSQGDNWVEIQLTTGKGWVAEDYVEINR